MKTEFGYLIKTVPIFYISNIYSSILEYVKIKKKNCDEYNKIIINKKNNTKKYLHLLK